MEFNEKLQQLRKSKGLTQEELAQAIFVSRTAVSKWESGRGYPNIDSLKELAAFFSITVDELISPGEILTAAANEKKELIGKYTAISCHVPDVFTALLLFIPVFGNGEGGRSAPLFAAGGAPLWIKIVSAVVIGLTVLNGVCGLMICRFDRPLWNKHRFVTGIALSVIACLLFIITRQPYASVFCFAILMIKGWFLLRRDP
ncbi:MAG: helix-turn-helix transcriptional regulator [Clostridia bacterium]|nr:helix-turn-helix transcriptional regulator [Clostridia bacterium]